MQVPNLRVVRRQYYFLQATIRRIQNEVIPRSEARIKRGTDQLSASVGRQLETTQRLLDPSK